MYADDTTLYCNVNQQITEQLINVELEKVSTWLSSNKLSLNVKKTKFMVFHPNQKVLEYPILKIGNNEIERVTNLISWV